jgi:hypothetical protein
MEFDPSYSPSEAFEADDTPLCSNCCDTGTFYADSGRREFCDCEPGCVAEANSSVGDDEDWDDSADERAQDSLDDMDYERGRMQGERYSMERKIYGSALADEFAFQDELNDYNRGL